MDNDTKSKQENHKEINEEQTNYLGIKRETDTELNKLDRGISVN